MGHYTTSNEERRSEIGVLPTAAGVAQGRGEAGQGGEEASPGKALARCRALRNVSPTLRQGETRQGETPWRNAGSPLQVLPRQSPRGGRQKTISPEGQWFSKVDTVFKHGFEGFYPLHHSGVVAPPPSQLLEHGTPPPDYVSMLVL